jgi:hypothetical protein
VAVPAAVQSAISNEYLALSGAVLNGDHVAEARILAPAFHDRDNNSLSTFEYDPLTIVVGNITRKGGTFEVRATYYGAHGRKIKTVDHWMLIDGRYRLLDRT